MKERDIVMCVILTIITCGIYGIYWFVCLTDDSLEITNEQGTSGITAVLLVIITCGLYSLYWAYKMGERLDSEQERRGMGYGKSYSGVLYLILDLVGFPIITWVLAQSEINKLSRQSWNLG